MRSNRPVRWWVTAVLCMSIVGQRLQRWRLEGDAADAAQAGGPALQMRRTTGPFAVVLTAGHPARPPPTTVPVANGDKLDPRAISAVVDRLPPFKAGSGSGSVQAPAGIAPAPSRRRHDHQAVRWLAAGAEADADRQRAPAGAALPADR